MKNLITSVKRTYLRLQIKLLDQRYIRMSHYLDYCEQQLQSNRKLAENNRTNTMLRRNRLRAQLASLGGV